MLLRKQVIDRYAATRQGTNCALVCHAPTVNLNFEQNGNVRACCYNTTQVLGQWPAQSIREIWDGMQLRELREHISHNNLGGGCTECGKMLESGNFQGVRARYYDEFAPDSLQEKLKETWKRIMVATTYPKVMEFELSNRCNLECVMCNGYFSSSIRKNREKLPAFESPYDDRFVDELEEFLPHLTDAKFLGGEPFMIDIYLTIWERIRKVNPNIRIHITTNGTFLTDRVKKLLEGLRAGIILSIDSVSRETYSKIRVNGDFDRVMSHLKYLHDYTRRKNTFLSMAVCPITLNWQELPNMLRFCIDRDILLYFNAVFSPAHLSLRELPDHSLEEVIRFLAAKKMVDAGRDSRSPRAMSIRAYSDFVLQLKGWLKEKEEHSAGNSNRGLETVFVRQPVSDWSLMELRALIQHYHSQTSADYIDKETELLNRLPNLLIDTPKDRLVDALMCYIEVLNLPAEDVGSITPKVSFIAERITDHPARETVLLQMGRSQPSVLARTLHTSDSETLAEQLSKSFG